MKTITVALFAASVLALSTSASAQTADPPAKRENARFVIVENIKFVPNGKERAEEIWIDHYVAAMKQAGVPLPTILHPDTGEWDYVIIYPLAGGITDLDYHNISPSDAKWWAIVERKAGSADKALAMGQELQRLIARKESYLAPSISTQRSKCPFWAGHGRKGWEVDTCRVYRKRRWS